MVNLAKSTGAPVLTFSTQGVAGPRQRDSWEQVVVGLHGQMRFEGAPFERYLGTLAARQFDAHQFVGFDAAPASSSRTATQAASDMICRYELLLVKSGELELQHCGHHTQLKPGDCTLVDMSRPHQMHYRRPLSAALIAWDRRLLDAKLPGATHSCGIGLPRDSAARAALDSYADTIRANLARWQDSEFQCVMTHLLDLTALMLDGQHDLSGTANASQTALLHRLKQFIHAHLAEDTITLSSVAAANGISLRYMQKLFQRDGVTPQQYLLEARLLRARALLRQRPMKHSVSSIAYMTGFGSASYFSAAYKRRFGLTARDESKHDWPLRARQT